MLAIIFLPAGTTSVKVGDMPLLFAKAVHPDIPENVANMVVGARKKFLTAKAKKKFFGNGATRDSMPLTDEDIAGLTKTCWKNLPVFAFPLLESEWQKYQSAFEQKPPTRDWGLQPTIKFPYEENEILQCAVADEWKNKIRDDVQVGKLIPRNPTTLLPAPQAMGAFLKKCIVPLGDFTAYAKGYDFDVGQIFTERARPLSVDAELQSLDDNVPVMVISNIDVSSGVLWCAAGQYRRDIQAKMERQTEGFFLLDEAAQELARVQPGIDIKAMIEQMRNAAINGHRLVRNYDDRLPVTEHRNIFQSMHLVKDSDIDAWLESLGVNYRFPQVTRAQTKAQKETATPEQRRERHDITSERGCRRLILEHWKTIEQLHPKRTDARQVERILKRGKGINERMPALKTIQNKLIELRKDGLIP